MRIGKSKNPFWLTSEKDNVGGKASRGIVLQFAQALLTIVTGVILARLLPPEDFGVVATLIPVITLVELLKSFGLTSYVIQSPNLKQSEVSCLFWIQLAFGFLLGAALAISGYATSNFFSDPRLIEISYVLGFLVFLNVCSGLHDALLRRHLLFGKVTAVQVISMLCGLVVGVLMALYDYGYWALVTQRVVVSLILFIGTWGLCSWRPNLVFNLRKVKSALRFGAGLTFGQFCDYLRRNVDVVLIRKYYGVQELGYYSRSYVLILAPLLQILGPVMAVAMPMLSRLQEDDLYEEKFSHVLRFCVAFAVPVSTAVFVMPEEFVYILLGANWTDAIPVVKGLSLAGMVLPIGNCLSVNFVVFRKTKLIMITTLLNLVSALIAYSIGIKDGAQGVAYAYGCSACIMVIVYTGIVVMNGLVRLKTVLLVLADYFPWMILASILVCLLKAYITINSNNFITSLIWVTVWGSLYVVFALLQKKNRMYLSSTWRLIKSG